MVNTLKFPQTLSELRKKKGFSQRRAAADLNISQALLSHYENGSREPGLAFICRACDYYGVTADYLLGRSLSSGVAERTNDVTRAFISELRTLANKTETALEELGL